MKRFYFSFCSKYSWWCPKNNKFAKNDLDIFVLLLDIIVISPPLFALCRKKFMLI